MSADKEAEADKLMKKANKLISPSLFDFRLKPDWENAGPMLDRAAMLYKMIGKTEKALEALERAATAQEKLGSSWHAAKHYETAADLANSKGELERVAEFYKMAADLYITSGKNTTGADALVKGAKALTNYDLDIALDMYLEALDIYEAEGRESAAMDIYRGAIGAMIKGKKYHDAVGLEMRFGAACEKGGAHSSQCRAYLAAVVIHLYGGDAKAAWSTFQEAMDVDVFSSSDEAYTADGLFEAYRNQSDDEVKDYVARKGVFKNLDIQVARLAMKLPNGKVKKMGKKINELMGGGDDEYEEQEEDLL